MRKSDICIIILLGILHICTFSVLQAQETVIGQEMTFDSYLNYVGKQNMEYLANRMNVDISEAEVIASRVLPDPSLDFEGSRETYKVGISWSLELGKRKARTDLAKSQAGFERLAFKQEFQELRAGAAELFIDAILQRELLKVKEDSYYYMLELNRSDSLRYLSGEINENDYRRTKLEAVSLRNEVYDQEAAYRSSLVELNRYMGVSSDTLNVPQGSLDIPERDFTLSALTEIGMSSRIDIAIASKSMDINEKEYRLVRAERRPDIGLSMSYERDWSSIAPQMRYVTAGISIPLSFSSANNGTLKKAHYRMKQTSILKQEVCLRVQSEITHAWYTFEAEKKKVAQYRSGILEEAQKVLDGMVYKYRRGETSILDVLIAQRSYNDVRSGYLEAMKGYASSLIELEKSCGMWDISF